TSGWRVNGHGTAKLAIGRHGRHARGRAAPTTMCLPLSARCPPSSGGTSGRPGLKRRPPTLSSPASSRTSPGTRPTECAMRDHLRSSGSGYLVAGLATAAAFGVRLLLDPLLGDHLPYLTFFAAVVAAAWHGGWWPGLLA